MSHASIIVISLTAAVACSSLACASREETDENTIATQQAQTSAATVARAFTEAGGAALTLYVPMARYGEKAPAQAGDAAPAEAEVQTGVEGVWSEAGFVADPSCISYAWVDLSVVIDFDSCVLPSTGELLDGALALGVSLAPLGMAVGFEDLVLGDSSFDGGLVLTLAGEPASLALQADMSFALDGGATDVVLEQVLVQADQNGVTAGGGFDIAAPTATAAVDFAAVHWASGECLPSSGSLAYEISGIPVLVTFLAETPATGVVTVQVGALPPSNEALLPPCSP